MMLFGEHEQVSMNKSFLEYFINVDRIFWKYYLTHGIEYFAMCSWMKDIYGWKMKMDELFNDCWQYTICLQKIEQKKSGTNLCWFLLKNSTHEMLKSYFIFFNMMYIQSLQHLNHIEFKTKSNLVTYKLIDPPRGMPIQTLTCWPPKGMCPLELKQYEVVHNILHYLYHLNFYFFSFILWASCIIHSCYLYNKIAFFSLLLLICTIYT